MASSQKNVELSDPNFNHIFKLLLIGDSGVGKSSLLLRFTANTFEEISPTIGVDFKVQTLRLDDLKIKLVVWDTAGQERFRTLTSSYYRGAQGVVLVYDVSKRDSFKSLADTWLREVELYSTNADCIKVLVGNKVDIDQRQVTREEGIEFAKAHGCLFLECSAKTKLNVEQVFEELVRKILETPSLVQEPERSEQKVNLSQTSPTTSSTCGAC